jgi:hypothetical protein
MCDLLIHHLLTIFCLSCNRFTKWYTHWNTFNFSCLCPIDFVIFPMTHIIFSQSFMTDKENDSFEIVHFQIKKPLILFWYIDNHQMYIYLILSILMKRFISISLNYICKHYYRCPSNVSSQISYSLCSLISNQKEKVTQYRQKKKKKKREWVQPTVQVNEVEACHRSRLIELPTISLHHCACSPSFNGERKPLDY